MSESHVQLVSSEGTPLYTERSLLKPALAICTEDQKEGEEVIQTRFPAQHLEWIIQFCRLMRDLDSYFPIQYIDLDIESLEYQLPDAVYDFITNDVAGRDRVEVKPGQRLRDFYDPAEWFDIPELMELIAHKVASLYVNKSYAQLKEWGLLFAPEIDEEKKDEITRFETLNTYYTIDIDARPKSLDFTSGDGSTVLTRAPFWQRRGRGI